MTETPLAKFAQRWGSDITHEAVTRADLGAVESKLSLLFPSDYVEQITTVGALWSPGLLDKIVDDHEQLELHDLQDLFAVKMILSETTSWRDIGMPKDLVVIGSDCMGNKFCFSERDLQSPTPTAPVMFWDHDLGETEEVAPSFSSWIQQYLDI